MNIFTRREKISILVCLVLLIALFQFPWLLPDNELIYLLFIVAPLGILLATDRERLARLKE